MAEENKQYQLTCLLSPLLEQKKIEEITQKIKKWIIEKGGSFSEKEKAIICFKKRLAYPLKKYQEAFYLNLNFLLTGQPISQLNQRLNSEKDILRYLIATKQKLKSKFTPLDKKYLTGQVREDIDYQMIDKIEPLVAKEVPLSKKSVLDKAVSDKKEKVKIEELDKKLEEILKQ